MSPSYSMTLFAQWRAAMALGTLTKLETLSPR